VQHLQNAGFEEFEYQKASTPFSADVLSSQAGCFNSGRQLDDSVDVAVSEVPGFRVQRRRWLEKQPV
jgi:hypothetical protein